MKVAIDIQSTIVKPTGIGYYTKNLIDEYKNHDEVDFYYYKPAQQQEFNTLERMHWENIVLRSYASRDKVDILHITGFAGPYINTKFKKITTVHDLIGMLYPQNLALVSRFYWQKCLPACVRTSDFIISDSENTKKDLVSMLNFPSNKIEVVHLAAAKEFCYIKDKSHCCKRLKELTGLENPFILSVSTIEPRKNFSVLLKAYSLCSEEIKKEFKIVIVGKKGWGFPQVEKDVKGLGLEKNIIFLNYVDTETLVLLYNCASVFVFPSFYEGFGLPVLEAFSCGVPVIASDTSSIPEVAQGAALLFAPNDIELLRDHMSEIIKSDDIQKDLSARGIDRAKDFNWEKTAEKTLDIYKRVYERY